MSPVTQIVLFAVFAAAGWGVAEAIVAESWIARVIGAVAGLSAGIAVRNEIAKKLGSLEDDGPREPPGDE